MAAQDKQAYALIRFGAARYQAAKNSLIKRLSVTENYGGKVLGICEADKICVRGTTCDDESSLTFPKDKGLAILSFGSMNDARRWESSVPEIKQSDWIGGVDIIIAEGSGKFDPCSLCLTMLMYEIDPCCVADLHESFKDIVPEIPKAMEQCGVNNIINNTTVERLRGQWDTNRFYVSQCASLEKLKEFEEKECLRAAREMRNRFGRSTMVLAKLEPLK